MGILPGRQKDPVGLSFEGNLVKYAELEPIGGGRMRVAGWGARSFSERNRKQFKRVKSTKHMPSRSYLFRKPTPPHPIR